MRPETLKDREITFHKLYPFELNNYYNSHIFTHNSKPNSLSDKKLIGIDIRMGLKVILQIFKKWHFGCQTLREKQNGPLNLLAYKVLNNKEENIKENKVSKIGRSHKLTICISPIVV